jgi:hypothetical protein
MGIGERAARAEAGSPRNRTGGGSGGCSRGAGTPVSGPYMVVMRVFSKIGTGRRSGRLVEPPVGPPRELVGPAT